MRVPPRAEGGFRERERERGREGERGNPNQREEYLIYLLLFSLLLCCCLLLLPLPLLSMQRSPRCCSSSAHSRRRRQSSTRARSRRRCCSIERLTTRLGMRRRWMLHSTQTTQSRRTATVLRSRVCLMGHGTVSPLARIWQFSRSTTVLTRRRRPGSEWTTSFPCLSCISSECVCVVDVMLSTTAEGGKSRWGCGLG